MPATKHKNIAHNNLLIGKNSSIILLSIFVILTSCIESYNPDIENLENMMVIIGELIETDTIQKVEISTSSDYNDREPQPISGCIVYVEDNIGNVFYYPETDIGIYTCKIDPQYLNIGTSYRLFVNTSDGNTYMSDFDKMVECPDIDTAFHHLESGIVGVDQLEVKGAQFYVKAKREDDQAKYCRWVLDETWEYRNHYAANAKIERDKIIIFPTLLFEPICWMSRKIASIYTAQISNHSKPYKINYVSNQSPRLYYKYSLHIKQFGINEGAYEFYTKLSSQFDNELKLYEKHPSSIISNIKNINNENETVLGYFNTASVKETRTFAERDWNMDVPGYCDFTRLSKTGEGWPDYGFYNTHSLMFSADSACFDCTARGGTSIKPEFWDD